MTANTKKIILFIVEGPTEEEALSTIFKRLFQSEEVRFHVVHGDITSDWSVSGANAIKTVNDHIKIEMDRYGFKRQDILQVIHLVDTDGAFIPAGKVIREPSARLRYFDDRIEAAAPLEIVERNERKARILQRLYPVGKVGAIPYHVYYFSRNLEHVLHNDSQALTDDKKAEFADDFAERYQAKPDEFITYLSSADFTVPGSYEDTWNFIMQDANSLLRHCNVHLLF